MTPSLDAGLLPGVLRTELVGKGEVHEGTVRVTDLSPHTRIWLVSAVRGWRQAVFVD